LGWAGWSNISDNLIIRKKITERSVEATIKTLATKDDLANLRKEMGNDLSNFRKEMGNDLSNFRKEMGEGSINFIKI
jgi:hypothetical protein